MANNTPETMKKKKLFNAWTHRSPSPNRVTKLKKNSTIINHNSESPSPLITNNSLRVSQYCNRPFLVLHEMFRRSIEDATLEES